MVALPVHPCLKPQIALWIVKYQDGQIMAVVIKTRVSAPVPAPSQCNHEMAGSHVHPSQRTPHVLWIADMIGIIVGADVP